MEAIVCIHFVKLSSYVSMIVICTLPAQYFLIASFVSLSGSTVINKGTNSGTPDVLPVKCKIITYM